MTLKVVKIMVVFLFALLCAAARKRDKRTADPEFQELLKRVVAETPEKSAPVMTKEDMRRKRNERASEMLSKILPEFSKDKARSRERQVKTLVREIVERLMIKQGVDDQLAYDLDRAGRLLTRAKDLGKRLQSVNRRLRRGANRR